MQRPRHKLFSGAANQSERHTTGFGAFLFGAATSSHQVEGGNRNDWSEWERKTANDKTQAAKNRIWPSYILKNYPGPLRKENYVSGRACDNYNRFEEDFDIAKKLGHNAHRFSLEWSRIEPEEGRFNEREIEHYRKVVRALRSRGMEPFVTIWHWTLPLWLRDKGGVLSKNFPASFERYAEKIASALGDDGVKFWITINEPEVYAMNSYLTGVWPPQKKNIFAYLCVLRNLIKAHRRAYSAIKKTNPASRIGVAKNNVYFEAYRDKFANLVLKKFIDWWQNFYFLNQIRNCQDFIGLNHYSHNRINCGFNKNENEKISDMGWELYPEAIYHVLKDLKRFNKPIYVTENGLADARDKNRGWFISESLQNVRKAMDDGADVSGYLHWSLLDNFEWDKGFWPRFGLVEVDYKTLKRKVRPSAVEYSKLIKRWPNIR